MSTPTRHPLAWPADWKRTASYQRTFGRFSTSARSGHYGSKQALTTADGVQRVLRELEAMGISENDVIVSTNVQTRLDGLPRSGAAEPADPGEPKARYTDSAHTNVRNTMARVRKQLRIQEQPKEADAA